LNDGVRVVREGSIDGIPAFQVDVPPPLTVALTFRVGAWDESLLTRGITHLVEHLCLHPFRNVEHPFNGVVSGDALTFWASGSGAQVVAFFARLGQHLRSVPVKRLETEADVLRAEAAGRRISYLDQIVSMYFGPNGPGLMAYPERGFDLVGPSEVQAWADRYCVQRNAVLTVSGPLPQGLRIGLPTGEPRRLTLPGQDVGYHPRRLELVADQAAGICFGTLAKRSGAAGLAWELFQERLTGRLRHELGLVYQVATAYIPLDDNHALLSAGTDAVPDRVEATAKGFMETLRQLRAHAPAAEEVARLQRIVAEAPSRDVAAFGRSEVWRIAMARLNGHQELSWEELMAERAAQTPDSVREAFRLVTERGGVIAPGRINLGLSPREKMPGGPVKGTRFSLWRKGPGAVEGLIAGRPGISAPAGGQWFTFRWQDIVLAERPRRGWWYLLHRNGCSLTFDTAAYWLGWWLERIVEKGVPPHVRLPRPRGK